MALPEALSDGLQAIFDYADTACVPKKHHKSGSPSHVAHLRLDADTDYVHTYSILHAVDSVLRRPGHSVISLDKLLIRQAIRNDLLLTVHEDGHHSVARAPLDHAVLEAFLNRIDLLADLVGVAE